MDCIRSKGRYAEVITSDVSDADELIRKFKYDYPQVAVSVDMLNTGFDCREIYLVMCRSVEPHLVSTNSRRGTRTTPHQKQRFVIYDFSGITVFQRQRRCLFGTEYRQRLWNSNQYAQRWF